MGGTCFVYRVHDLTLDRTLALKVLRHDIKAATQLRERFHREAVITARLEHPGIIPIHRVGQLTDGRPYALMPMVKGKTFEELIKEAHATRSGPGLALRTLRRMVEYIRRVSNALAFAHEQRVIHRDVKPANIMIGGFDNLFVLDWGIAKVLDQTHSDDENIGMNAESSWPSTQATRIGRAIGTPAYMPPEQARGDHQATTESADIYALSATLYAVITGRQPHHGSVSRVLQRLREGRPPPPIDPHICPPDLRMIVERGLQADPRHRFGSMVEMAGAIDDWLTGRERAEQALAEAARATQALAEFSAVTAPLSCASASVRDGHSARRSDLIRRARAHVERGLQLDQTSLDIRRLWRKIERITTIDTYDRRSSGLPGQLDLAEQTATSPQHPISIAIAVPDSTSWRLFPFVRETPYYRPAEFWFDGTGPDVLHGLPRGSYVLEAQIGEHLCRIPAYVPPFESSLGSEPHPLLATDSGDSESALTITLHPPRSTQLRSLDPASIVVVVGGPFLSGGDMMARNWRPSVWRTTGAFAIQRRAVDFRSFLRFLRSDHGRPYARLPDRWVGPRDGSDPVHHIPVTAAKAYAEWLTTGTGRLWRLPTTSEWEKAARGVDGRLFPWGDAPGGRERLVVALEGVAQTTMPANLLPPESAEHPDRSVYDAEFLAGGVCEYCTTETGDIVGCGGSFRRGIYDARASMTHHVALEGDADVGFRLVTPLNV